jgi:hypothetical protein
MVKAIPPPWPTTWVPLGEMVPLAPDEAAMVKPVKQAPVSRQ